MSDYLKGNYKLPESKTASAAPPSAPKSGQDLFEASALQKLGGSIAFIKKSSSFVWNGDKGKKDDARPNAR